MKEAAGAIRIHQGNYAIKERDSRSSLTFELQINTVSRPSASTVEMIMKSKRRKRGCRFSVYRTARTILNIPRQHRNPTTGQHSVCTGISIVSWGADL